jgi:hypothetical protein
MHFLLLSGRNLPGCNQIIAHVPGDTQAANGAGLEQGLLGLSVISIMRSSSVVSRAQSNHGDP